MTNKITRPSSKCLYFSLTVLSSQGLTQTPGYGWEASVQLLASKELSSNAILLLGQSLNMYEQYVKPL